MGYRSHYEEGADHEAGEQSPKRWPSGITDENVSDQMNMESNVGAPSAVGAFSESQIAGVDDWLGNVWEWCMDGRPGYARGAHLSPSRSSESGSSRVPRGVAWDCRPADAYHPGGGVGGGAGWRPRGRGSG